MNNRNLALSVTFNPNLSELLDIKLNMKCVYFNLGFRTNFFTKRRNNASKRKKLYEMKMKRVCWMNSRV